MRERQERTRLDNQARGGTGVDGGRCADGHRAKQVDGGRRQGASRGRRHIKRGGKRHENRTSTVEGGAAPLQRPANLHDATSAHGERAPREFHLVEQHRIGRGKSREGAAGESDATTATHAEGRLHRVRAAGEQQERFPRDRHRRIERPARAQIPRPRLHVERCVECEGDIDDDTARARGPRDRAQHLERRRRPAEVVRDGGIAADDECPAWGDQESARGPAVDGVRAGPGARTEHLERHTGQVSAGGPRDISRRADWHEHAAAGAAEIAAGPVHCGTHGECAPRRAAERAAGEIQGCGAAAEGRVVERAAYHSCHAGHVPRTRGRHASCRHAHLAAAAHRALRVQRVRPPAKVEERSSQYVERAATRSAATHS